MVQRDRETSAVRSTKVVDFNAAIHLSTSASPLLWVGAESISPPEVLLQAICLRFMRS